MSAKDAREIVKMLRRQGYQVELSGRDHWRVTLPKGTVVFAQTPSDHRFRKTVERDLRAGGWPGPQKKGGR